MSISLFLEQVLNGLQFGVMLFLMSAWLTLVFGVMGLINLAHGSLYMIGAFSAAAIASWTGSFWLGLVASLTAAAIAGVIVEIVIIRRLYRRDHLDQVLATFALILLFSEAMRWIFGAFPLYLDVPDILSGTLNLPLGIEYSKYRMMIIVVGILIAIGLFALISKTRLGVRIRAGESDREMIAALGVDISRLYTLVFALGAALAGLAGAMVGAIQSVEVGMGEPVLILAFVVIVIGGIGSIKGALIGAILVGLTDTLGRFLLPSFFKIFLSPSSATDCIAPTIAPARPANAAPNANTKVYNLEISTPRAAIISRSLSPALIRTPNLVLLINANNPIAIRIPTTMIIMRYLEYSIPKGKLRVPDKISGTSRNNGNAPKIQRIASEKSKINAKVANTWSK